MSDSSEPTVRIAEYDPLHQTLLDAVSDLENLASHPKKRSKGKLYEFVEVYDSFDSAHKALTKDFKHIVGNKTSTSVGEKKFYKCTFKGCLSMSYVLFNLDDNKKFTLFTSDDEHIHFHCLYSSFLFLFRTAELG